MFRFWRTSLTLAFASQLLAPLAFGQGGSIGGGGGAFVCKDKDGKKYSVLVDLWESERTKFLDKKIKIAYSDEDPEAQFAKAMQRLALVSPELAEEVSKIKVSMLERVKDIESDVKLPTPVDLRAIYAPKNCDVVGMMYFDDKADELNIDPNVFGILRTKTDIAAAWAHEAIYKAMRKTMDHKDSTLTRRLVGCLFSHDSECINPKSTALTRSELEKEWLNGTESGNPPTLAYSCKNQYFDITVFPAVCVMTKFCETGLKDKSKVRSVRAKDAAKDVEGLPEFVSVLRVMVHNLSPNGLASSNTGGFGLTAEIGERNELVQLEQPYGPLSEYGYTPKHKVELKTDGKGNFWVERISTQGPNFSHGLGFGKKAKCEPYLIQPKP